MNFIIRKSAFDDLDRVLGLYPHLFSSDDPSPQRKQLEDTWLKFVSNPAMTCLLVLSDEKPIGSCCLMIVPNLTRGGRSYALIENVVVHDEYRKRGVGRAVTEEAIRQAKESNCYKIMLLSGADNKHHAFYERLGFDRNRKVGFEMSLR
jgi:ribosomal protein S18 acetylase RimI-like enzyme